MLRVSRPGTPSETGHQPRAALYVGSAVKTFINLRFLQDVEAGRLSENTQEVVDDGVRSLASPVFGHLTGTTTARSVLEAMIAHSDNTATDIALKRVGPDRVRAFIASADFKSIKIPGSTRLLFSYLAGAPFGVDFGWKGMLEIENDKVFGRLRSPLNDRETMKCLGGQPRHILRAGAEGLLRRGWKPDRVQDRIQAIADALPLIRSASVL